MKKIYILIIIVLSFIVFILFVTNIENSKTIKRYETVKHLKYITVNSNGENTVEKKLEDINEKDKYKIQIYYPDTKYEILNKEIDLKIQEYIKEFKKDIKGSIQSQQYYTLNSKYTIYTYKEYISYMFNFFIDTGGAHPNTYIWTITYDTKNNKIISINDLIKKDKDLLNKLSNISYDILSKDKKIKDSNSFDMLKDGTKPTKDNFNKFAFTKDTLIIFFDTYQIAPYYLGQFHINIPYKDLNI